MNDLTTTYSSFINQLNHLQASYTNLQNQESISNSNLSKTTKDLQDSVQMEQDLKEVNNYFKILEEKLTQQQISQIETLCNDALDAVFNDNNYRYNIKIETELQRNNNQLYFRLITTELNTQEVTVTNLEDNGFGIQSLVGFVLQIYYIITNNQAHILLMDESLTAISKDHLQRLNEFIHQITDHFNFYFVLVSHDSDLTEIGDYHYIVNQGELKEVK